MCLQSIQTGHVVYSSTIYYNFGHLKSGTTFLDYNFQFSLSAFIKGVFFVLLKYFPSLVQCSNCCGSSLSIGAHSYAKKPNNAHVHPAHLFQYKKTPHREQCGLVSMGSFSFGKYKNCLARYCIVECTISGLLLLMLQFAFDVLFCNSPKRLKTLSTVQFKIKKMVLFVYVWFPTNGSIMLVLLYKKTTKQ